MAARSVTTLPGAWPGWVSDAVRHYLRHTEDSASLRVLAEGAGCHASTVLRQIRRVETRRDDPLVDNGLARLAAARSDRFRPRCMENTDMSRTAPNTSRPGSGLPGEDTLAREARRVLRRLSEPGACLAVAPGMESAVVVRETADGRTVRTAVLDRGIAEAMALQDWIAGETVGRIARHRITPAGRAALKRMLAEDEAARTGAENDRFASQHREMETREIAMPCGEGPSRRVRYNAAESPLSALARRRDKSGAPFLPPELVNAGERLREDFEVAQMGPRVTQNWDRFLTAGAEGGPAPGAVQRGPEAARARVMAALSDLGPGLGDVALRCCCFLEGLEQAEKRLGWSARSGKIVLRIALQRLKRHYDELGEGAALIG